MKKDNYARRPLNQNSAPDQTKRKRSIEANSPSPLNFLSMCIFSLFKKFVFPQTHIKIGIYFGLLFLFSFAKDFNIANQKLYLASKRNVFNIYFVKIGWGWTLAICAPFVLMTSIVTTGFNRLQLLKSLSRLAVATFIWFVCTSLFEFIESKTGRCIKPLYETKLECRKNNHEWIDALDISGHTFLLMHALFVMLEEVKVFNYWETLRKKLDEQKINESTNNNEQQTSSSSSHYNLMREVKYWYDLLTPFIRINFILMALLALLWEMMLFSTFLYFHAIMHKLLAAFFAVIAWFLTYKTWYANQDLNISPDVPCSNVERLV